jgi:hypothetical protein
MRRGASCDRRGMPTFLLESYGANYGDAFANARERALLAAELGRDVRYLRTTFLPREETLLHVFEATSPEALRRAARLAALTFERIVEAVEGSELDQRQARGDEDEKA